MRQTISVKRSNPAASQPDQGMKGRLLDTLRNMVPGAWIDPKNNELITLYRLRYKMAMEEAKYDTAMIFLNKILELDPMNLDAKLCKGDIYHRCLGDFPRAIEQYNKVIRLSDDNDTARTRARAAMSEIMELLS
jgi:tetratricopeptide (TPR) repeat protein